MSVIKTAIVVGAGPGTGGAVARKFAKEGFAVGLVSRSSKSSQPAYDQITSDGGKALIVTADTGVESDVKNAYKQIVDTFKVPPSVLIYHTGARFPSHPPSILEMNPTDFLDTFKVGTVGALLWMQQVIPEQVKAGEGTIIVTGASASRRGSAKFAQLAGSKFALRSLAQSAAREFHPKGIHVAHVVIDGVIKTEATAKYGMDKRDEDYLWPEQIAEEYWKLHTQHKTVWTQEAEFRPFSESF